MSLLDSRLSYLDYLPFQLELLLLGVHQLEFGIGCFVSQCIVLLLQSTHLHRPSPFHSSRPTSNVILGS